MVAGNDADPEITPPGEPSWPPAPAAAAEGRVHSMPGSEKCLDPIQLEALERAFREWRHDSPRADIRSARYRVLLIFLLIRYTGAKLSEVLGLDLQQDVDCERRTALLRRGDSRAAKAQRQVPLPAALCDDIRRYLNHARATDAPTRLAVDPGFVRRKFYERAEACGLAKALGAPEVLRRSRAVELMQNHMPLPAVQMLLGHGTPNLTSAYVTFSEAEMEQVTRTFMEKEGVRRTSARNSFYGKVRSIQQDAVQSMVELATMGGHLIRSVITNHSARRLGLQPGKTITAEVKAPWLMLQKGAADPASSADNALHGTVRAITRAAVNVEYIVRLADETEVCAIVTRTADARLGLAEGDPVTVLFSSFAVVLLAE